MMVMENFKDKILPESNILCDKEIFRILENNI